MPNNPEHLVGRPADAARAAGLGKWGRGPRFCVRVGEEPKIKPATPNQLVSWYRPVAQREHRDKCEDGSSQPRSAPHLPRYGQALVSMPAVGDRLSIPWSDIANTGLVLTGKARIRNPDALQLSVHQVRSGVMTSSIVLMTDACLSFCAAKTRSIPSPAMVPYHLAQGGFGETRCHGWSTACCLLIFYFLVRLKACSSGRNLFDAAIQDKYRRRPLCLYNM